MSGSEMAETVVIVNPESGTGDHLDTVYHRAQLRGYVVEETEGPGDAIELAHEAVEGGASTVVAAGGDGTLNEVLRGVDRADGLDRVTVGVVPVGTGNNFAGNVGIADVDDAFHAIAEGERRWIDLGRTDGHLFVNSCVAGLTAESSDETTPEMKERLGVLAYVIETLRTVREVGSLPLEVGIYEDGREMTAWTGDALVVLVGNGRRFAPTMEDTQANMEDGRLDVSIVKDVSSFDLVEEAVAGRIFGEEAPHVTRVRASEVEIVHRESGSIHYSLDGEMVEARSLSLWTQPRTVRIPVGEGYDPNPTPDSDPDPDPDPDPNLDSDPDPAPHPDSDPASSSHPDYQ